MESERDKTNFCLFLIVINCIFSLVTSEPSRVEPAELRGNPTTIGLTPLPPLVWTPLRCAHHLLDLIMEMLICLALHALAKFQ